MSIYYVLLLIILLIGGFVFHNFYKKNIKTSGNNVDDSRYLSEILYRDRQIQKLSAKIKKLSELNSRYLSFILKFPLIIQRMNSTSKIQMILQDITEMINDLISTNKVNIYLFDESTKMLNKISGNGNLEEEKTSYALGEGLIGTSAKQRFIMLREHFEKIYSQNQNIDSRFWMAVPITFKDRLLGVIGIGEIDSPTGNESDLLKMIADIAGVTIMNQMMLEEAQHKANTDSLTGLNNRNYFFKMAQFYIDKAVRERTDISIFLFDIDNFKHYNDTNGHNAGDKLLIELSQLLRLTTQKNSIIARYGGEEFIVLLPHTSKEDAFEYADNFRTKVSQYPFQNGEKQPLGFVSISGGIASFPEDGDTIHKVIEMADVALYKAKSSGKNLILYHKSVTPKNAESLTRD